MKKILTLSAYIFAVFLIIYGTAAATPDAVRYPDTDVFESFGHAVSTYAYHQYYDFDMIHVQYMDRTAIGDQIRSNLPGFNFGNGHRPLQKKNDYKKKSNSIPEPTTLVLIGIGMTILALFKSKIKRLP